MATGTKSAARSIILDTTSAIQSVSNLEKEIKKLDGVIERGKKNGKDMTDEIAKMGNLKNQLQGVNDLLAKGMAPSLRELQKAAKEARKELSAMSASDPNFSKKVQEYNKAVQALNEMKDKTESVKKASSSMFESFLGAGLVANLISNITERVKSLVQESVKLALQAEGVKRAFDNLNRPGLLDELRTATKGTVSDFELMKRAVQANNFQIPLEGLAKLLQFAQTRARETGESVDYLVESIVTGIARKSPLILDNLGINIQRVQKEFEKTGDFAMAAMNVVNQEMDKSGPKIDSVADKVDRLKASFQNFLTSTGGLIVEFAQSAELLFNFWFNRAQFKIDEAMIYQSRELKKSQDLAFSLFNAFAQRYASSDKASQEKLLEQLRVRIEKQKSLEAEYRKQGLFDQAQYYSTLVKQGEQFIAKMGSNQKSNTLAALESEKQLLEGQLKGLDINSPAFAKTRKRIQELQEQINKALGAESAKKGTDVTSQLKTRFETLFGELNTLVRQANMSPLEKAFDSVNQRIDITRKLIEELRRNGLNKIANDLEAILPTAANILSGDAIRQFDRGIPRGETASVRTGISGIGSRLTSLISGRTKPDIGSPVAGTDQEKEAAKQRVIAKIQEIVDFAQQANQVLDGFAQAANNRENAEFRREQRRNEQRRRQIEGLARAKVITENEATIQLRKIDEQEEKRRAEIEKRQFERNKRLQIAQTFMNAAAGAIQLWVKPGFPANIPLLAILAAQTAAQIAVINSQKPAFRYGGIVHGGSSHGSRYGESGIALIDRTTGQELGEMQRGEAILSRAFVRQNRSIMPALLRASREAEMGNARTLNLPAIMNAYGRRMYAYGGIVPQGGDAGANGATMNPAMLDQMNMAVQNLIDTNNALINRLNKPLAVSHQRIKEAYDLESRILNQAAMR